MYIAFITLRIQLTAAALAGRPTTRPTGYQAVVGRSFFWRVLPKCCGYVLSIFIEGTVANTRRRTPIAEIQITTPKTADVLWKKKCELSFFFKNLFSHTGFYFSRNTCLVLFPSHDRAFRCLLVWLFGFGSWPPMQMHAERSVLKNIASKNIKSGNETFQTRQFLFSDLETSSVIQLKSGRIDRGAG